MARALITGITGQTGSYLCDELLAAGWEVVGLVRDRDDLEAGLRERSPGAGVVHGDLADPDGLSRMLRTVEPDAVFNLGGISSVAQSWDQPRATAQVTGLAPAILLAAALDWQNERGIPVAFVQASSAEMYGAADRVPQDESTPVRPVSPYGAAKAYAHHLVGVYRGAGLGASSCILYNHESPRRPETFVTRKITTGVARIARGLEDYLVLGNLDAVRDWGWAPDYAHALALAANVPGDYVIATGVGHTVRDFVEAAFRAAGVSPEGRIRQDPRFLRATDAPELVGDASCARERLGWQPTVDFEGIVRAMVDHDLSRLDHRQDPPG